MHRPNLKKKTEQRRHRFLTIFSVRFCPSRKFRVWILSLHYWFPQSIARLPHQSCALAPEQIFRWYQKVLRRRSRKASLFNFSLCRGKTRSTCIWARFLWICGLTLCAKSEFKRESTRLRCESTEINFSDDKTRRHCRNLTARGGKKKEIMLHDFEFSSISNISERGKMWKVFLPLRLYGCSTVNDFLSIFSVRRRKNFPFAVLWRNSYAFVVCSNRCSVKSYEDWSLKQSNQ